MSIESGMWDMRKAADYVAVSKKRLYQACRSKELKSIRMTNRKGIRTTRKWIDEWLGRKVTIEGSPEKSGDPLLLELFLCRMLLTQILVHIHPPLDQSGLDKFFYQWATTTEINADLEYIWERAKERFDLEKIK